MDFTGLDGHFSEPAWTDTTKICVARQNAGGAAAGPLGALAGAGVGSLAALGAAAIGLVATLASVGKDLLGLQRNGVDQRGSNQHPTPGSTGSEWGWLGDWWKNRPVSPSKQGAHPRTCGVSPSSYLAPEGGGGERTLQAVVMQMDGQTIGKIVLAYASRGATGPSTGQTGYDLRTVPVGGMAGAAA